MANKLKPETLDSRDAKVIVWPKVLYSHGAWYAYIRIKRHRKYWLVLQQQFAGIGTAEALMSFLEQFHFNAYKLFHLFIVDRKNPMLQTGRNQKHPAYYLDINQQEECDLLSKT